MVSLDTAQRMLQALAKESAGNEILTILNNSQAGQAVAGWSTPAMIIAAHASATTDFSALKVGDIVIHTAAGAFGANHVGFAVVVTAGTNPDGAGVIGDLYEVRRQIVFPAASNVTL